MSKFPLDFLTFVFALAILAGNSSAARLIDFSSPADISPFGLRSAESHFAGRQSYAGIVFETLEGKVLKEDFSNYAFNPASNVKTATSFAVIKVLGPDYRFPTRVLADGTVNTASRTLNGNVYITGRDPAFAAEHAVALAETLNRIGISRVNGDLVVTDKFVMNQSDSPHASAQNLFSTLDAAKRSAAAASAWKQFLASSGKGRQSIATPSVKFTGDLYVDILPSNVTHLFSHESAPLRDIVKLMMCYSNNFLAERLGDVIGGPYAVARVVQQNSGTTPEEFFLQSSSGLGMNRVTPKAMMRLLRAFRTELVRHKMTFADVMPVAGVDPGTLRGRFNSASALGSVVAKTGTLDNTDAGVSALSGEIQTRRGKILFVIFNQRGPVARFRGFQDSLVASVQNANGGAAPLGYNPATLTARMANTRISFPKS